MAILETRRISKTYPSKKGDIVAIGDVSFNVEHNEVFGIVGPSGAGKTTLLKCLAGLLQPTSGEVTLLGQRVTKPPREMAMVFQDYSRSLLPWLTVADNVALPLRCQKVPKSEIVERCQAVLAAVGLANRGTAYPWQLSGGMQQRVAIARGLAFRPEVLLLDEPFGSLDAQTRSELEDLVHDIRGRFDMTFLLVTHDIDEAVYLCDRVAVLSEAPSRVKEVLDIHLDVRGNQVTSKALPEFSSYRGQIISLIKGGNLSEVGADAGSDRDTAVS